MQNTCLQDPVGVSNCLLNMKSTAIKIKVKCYDCFPFRANNNCRDDLSQHQNSIQSCYISGRRLEQRGNYFSICSSDTFVRILKQQGTSCGPSRHDLFTDTDMIDLSNDCAPCFEFFSGMTRGLFTGSPSTFLWLMTITVP